MDGISEEQTLNITDICQLDGNASVDSSYLSGDQSFSCQVNESEASNNIPVITFTTRVNRPEIRDAPQILRQVHRNPRVNASSSLPVVAVANVRSLLPKLNSFIKKVENESITLCLICEIWEQKGKRNRYFQSKNEEYCR